MLLGCVKKLGKRLSSVERAELERSFDTHLKSGLSEYDASMAALAEYHKSVFDQVNEVRAAVRLKPAEYKPYVRSVVIPEPSTTAAKKVSMSADREALDLPELPPAERKKWQTTLDEAKSKGTQNASALAEQVLAKPRALNDVETGQLILRAQEIKNEHAAKMKEIGAATDPNVISAKRNEVDALEREFDKITTATKKSGTEKGRALASQKLTINQDYDLVSLVQRAKAAKGQELNPEERAKIQQQATRISELETKLAEAEKAAEARAIEKDIARVRRQIKRGETKQVLDDEFAALRQQFAQAKAEIKGVQPSLLAGLDPEGKLTPIILRMARNRIKSGAVTVDGVIDYIHGAIDGHISKDDIRALLAGHNLERDPLPAIKKRLGARETELTKQLETGDFTKPEPRKRPIYDKEASDLKARVEGLKRKVDAEIRGTDSKLETAIAVWKAGLLSGPRTHMRNIGGTAGFQGFEEVARIPGSIIDMAVSAVTKQRALSGPSPVAMARSSYEAATRGITEAKQIIKYGATAEELKIADRPREVNSGLPVLDAYTNFIFRTLGAEDKVFRTYAAKRSGIDQARLIARNEARAGKIKRSGIAERQKYLEENPTPEMQAQMVLDAETATFNNANVIAKGAEWVRSHTGPVGKVAIELIAPFRRTPANIMTRLLESTPLGIPKASIQLYRASINKKISFEEQRKFSQTIGRSVTGSSLIALGALLASKGLATGLYESDYGDREVQKAAGQSPMAVRIGDNWHQIGAFSPIGNLIAIGAALYREKNRPPKEGEEPRNVASAALPVAVQTMLEQPMLRGMSGVIEAIKEPGSRGAAFVGQTVGSTVPAIVSNIGELTDDRRREARGITPRIQSRIPILRRRLPEDVDVFARPRETRRTNVIDPTMTTSARDDKFIQELRRLDVGVVKTPRKHGEDEAKYREKMMAQGKEIAKELAVLVESPRYQTLPDEEKKEAIKDKIEQVRKGVSEYIKTGGKRQPREPRRPRQIPYRYRPTP